MKTIARFLAQTLSPEQMITLGSSLVLAGNAARAKQKAINEALENVSAAVTRLVEG